MTHGTIVYGDAAQHVCGATSAMGFWWCFEHVLTPLGPVVMYDICPRADPINVGKGVSRDRIWPCSSAKLIHSRRRTR